jgi:hypothetical protein
LTLTGGYKQVEMPRRVFREQQPSRMEPPPNSSFVPNQNHKPRVWYDSDRPAKQQKRTMVPPPYSDPDSVAVYALDDPDPKRDASAGREVEQRPADEIERPADDRRRRRVRFATAAGDRDGGDGEGRVVEEVFRYRAVSDRRKGLCYMSRREQGEARQRATAFAETFADLHEDWHGTIAGLLLGSDGGSGDDKDDDEDEEEEAVLILTEASARGLEFSSRFLRKHQEWTNRSVLRRHRQLREDDDTGADEGSALLGEHCARLNRRTSGMAAQLGRGDALQARIVYEEDGVWATWKRDDRWEGDPLMNHAGCGGDLRAPLRPVPRELSVA